MYNMEEKRNEENTILSHQQRNISYITGEMTHVNLNILQIPSHLFLVMLFS